MDSITQVALGASIGAAGFGHRLGRKAVVFGGFCGLLPDLDFILGVGDAWRSLVVHRGASHSLLVLPIVGVVLGWLMWWIAKKRDTPWTWAHLAVWGLVTHPLLDLFTAYGTQLFAPFSRTRFAIDGVAIIDLVYTIPLLVVMFVALRGRRDWAHVRRMATVALCATTAYLFLGLAQSRLAISRTESAIAGLSTDFEPVAIRANPTFFNTMLFRVVARDAQGNILVGTASTWGGGPTEFLRYDWPSDDPWVAAVLASEEGKIFRWFANEFLRVEVVPDAAGGAVVTLLDARYGSIADPSQPIFTAVFEVGAEGSVEVARLENVREVEVGRELVALFRGVVGDHPSLEGAARGGTVVRLER